MQKRKGFTAINIYTDASVFPGEVATWSFCFHDEDGDLAIFSDVCPEWIPTVSELASIPEAYAIMKATDYILHMGFGVAVIHSDCETAIRAVLGQNQSNRFQHNSLDRIALSMVPTLRRNPSITVRRIKSHSLSAQLGPCMNRVADAVCKARARIFLTMQKDAE